MTADRVDATVAALAEAGLGPEGGRAALGFLEAVASQLGAPLEVGGRLRAPEREREAARAALHVLRAATAPEEEGGGVDAAAALLARDPSLLAVFFGNVDLLFAAGYPGADAVGVAVVQAAWLVEHGGAEG